MTQAVVTLVKILYLQCHHDKGVAGKPLFRIDARDLVLDLLWSRENELSATALVFGVCRGIACISMNKKKM